MEKNQLDWGDLLYLYTLANSRSLQDAAEQLEVNRTTVSRKIDNLEQSLGVKLFVRSGRDLEITEAGELALKSAVVVRDEVQELQRSIRERESHLEGIVRITATPRMCALLEPALSKFLLEHPDIELEFSASMQLENLGVLESDIALRLTYDPPAELIGRRLALPASALYASEEFANAMPESGELNYIEGVRFFNIKHWMEEDLGFTPNIVMKSNSTDLVVHFVRSSVGTAYLPCYVGELEPGLVRVSGVRRDEMPELWMLYSTKHREVARIKAVAKVIEEAVAELVPMIEGHTLEG